MSTNAHSPTKESNVDTSAVVQAGAAAAAAASQPAPGSFRCVFTWPSMQKASLTLAMPASSLAEKDPQGTSMFSGKLRFGGGEVSLRRAVLGIVPIKLLFNYKCSNTFYCLS